MGTTKKIPEIQVITKNSKPWLIKLVCLPRNLEKPLTLTKEPSKQNAEKHGLAWMLVARHRAALGLREKAILREEGKLGLGIWFSQ